MTKQQEHSLPPPDGGNSNQASIDEHSWKLAQLAAILSTRLPLRIPDKDDEEAWALIAGKGKEYSPYNVANPDEDELYLGCLKRANFLLSNVPGAGREMVFAEDLFTPGKRYKAESMAKRFKAAGWPTLKSGNTARTWIQNTLMEVQNRVSKYPPNRHPWFDPLLVLRSELTRTIDEGDYEAHTVFSLARELRINAEILQANRSKLINPPPPQIPDQRRPWNWNGALVAHYEVFFKLKSPWYIATVTTANQETTIRIHHLPQCLNKGCDAGIVEMEPAEDRETLFRLGTGHLKIIARRFATRCLKHHKQDAPSWPSFVK